MIILIAGGTGLIGDTLVPMLQKQGHQVRILTRSPKSPNQYKWDPANGEIDETALENINALVNLAGAGIAHKRWTDSGKKLIIDSRTQSIQTLQKALERTGVRPSVFVGASAIGIYGDSGEIWQTETTPVTENADRPFMVGCCDLWESASDQFSALGIRTVKIRIGVVLSQEGGALKEVAQPVQFGLGTYFGNGKAWYSWVHIEDIARLFQWAINTTEANGVYNGTAPHPVRNKTLVKSIATAMHRPALPIPVPEFALRLVLGEMSAVVLNSNRVSSEKVVKAGFKFNYPEIEEALADIYAKK